MALTHRHVRSASLVNYAEVSTKFGGFPRSEFSRFQDHEVRQRVVVDSTEPSPERRRFANSEHDPSRASQCPPAKSASISVVAPEISSGGFPNELREVSRNFDLTEGAITTRSP